MPRAEAPLQKSLLGDGGRDMVEQPTSAPEDPDLESQAEPEPQPEPRAQPEAADSESDEAGDAADAVTAAKLLDDPWVKIPLSIYGFARRRNEEDNCAVTIRGAKAWWLWGLFLLVLQVINTGLWAGVEVAEVLNVLGTHSVDTIDLSDPVIPYQLGIDTDLANLCCAEGDDGADSSPTRCIVPTCLPLFAEHQARFSANGTTGWAHDWVNEQLPHGESRPAITLATQPADYTVTTGMGVRP